MSEGKDTFRKRLTATLNRPLPLPHWAFPASLGIALGLVAGMATANYTSSRRWSQVIAMQRTFLSHSFYTNPIPANACVVVKPSTNGVTASLHLEMRYPRFGAGHRSLELGLAPSVAEAMSRWGSIEWREGGLQVGKGSNVLFLSKQEVESGGR